MYNPVKTIKTNTVGTVNALGLAKRVNAKILIASTSEVYGDPEVHPQSESYWGHVNPIGPRACYDEGKRVAETLAYAYHKQSKVDIRVARIFNTYGPRMHMNDGRVVSNFILQALQDEPISVSDIFFFRYRMSQQVLEKSDTFPEIQRKNPEIFNPFFNLSDLFYFLNLTDIFSLFNSTNFLNICLFGHPICKTLFLLSDLW